MTFKLPKSVGILFLLTVMLISLQWIGPSHAGDNIWTTTGPYGVYVHDILIDPTDPLNLYAATGGAVSIYRSVDGGQIWLPVTTGLPAESLSVPELANDPNDPQTIYAATSRGLYMSTDAGVTWQQKGSAKVGETSLVMDMMSVAISPSGDKMYAVTGGGDGALDYAPVGVYVSSDGGDNFYQSDDDTIENTELAFVRYAPTAPHILYLAGNFDGLYKSIDGGQSWERADSAWGVPPQVLDVAFDPYSANTVYVSLSGAGLFRTTNGGASWIPVASTDLNSSQIVDIVLDPGNQQVIYVAGREGPGAGTPGVYRSLDNLGFSWESLVNGMGSRGTYSLAINHEDPQTLYAGTQSGIWSYTLVSGPEDYSVSINDGALFTNQSAVTLTLSAPVGTGSMLISNDGGFGGAIWEPFVVTRTWEITAYGQSVVPRVVYAKFRTGGMTSDLYLDDIILDTTPPAGGVEATAPTSALSVAPTGSDLWHAAEAPQLSWARATSNTLFLPAVVKNVDTSLSLVRLLLSASDDVSGVESMAISSQPELGDGQWEPYIERKTLRLAPLSTVYVWYRDRAGNVSPVYSDEVP